MSKKTQLDPETQKRMLKGFYAVFAFLFTVAGIGLIIYGIVMPKLLKDEYKSCTETISATVIENRRFESSTRSSTDHMEHTRVSYAPVYSFEVGGKTYTGISSSASNPPEHKVGEKIEIHYDPDDPSKNYYKDISMFIRIACTGGGGIFLIVGVISIRNLIKAIRQ